MFIPAREARGSVPACTRMLSVAATVAVLMAAGFGVLPASAEPGPNTVLDKGSKTVESRPSRVMTVRPDVRGTLDKATVEAQTSQSYRNGKEVRDRFLALFSENIDAIHNATTLRDQDTAIARFGQTAMAYHSADLAPEPYARLNPWPLVLTRRRSKGSTAGGRGGET